MPHYIYSRDTFLPVADADETYYYVGGASGSLRLFLACNYRETTTVANAVIHHDCGITHIREKYRCATVPISEQANVWLITSWHNA